MSSSTKPFCFVLMPTDGTDTLYQVIFEVCQNLGVHCDRVEKKNLDPSAHIIDSILKDIRTADLIVYDATGRSANVFFEVGFATALDKPMIRLASDKKQIPYDTRTHQYLLHENSPEKLRAELKPRLEHLVKNLNAAPNIGEPRIGLYEEGRALMRSDQVAFNLVNTGQRLQLVINLVLTNQDPTSFRADDVILAVKAPYLSFVQHHNETIEAYASPDECHGISTIEHLGGLVFGQTKGLSMHLAFKAGLNLAADLDPSFAITIQVLTPIGMREWELTLSNDE